MSKSYNQLVNELKRANKQIKNFEFLEDVEAQEQKKINSTNLELWGRINGMEKTISKTQNQLADAEMHCVEHEKKINRLNECLKSKNEFIEDLQGQINNLINYCEILKDNHNKDVSSVNELMQVIKTISKYLN